MFTVAVFRYRSCHVACSIPFARFWRWFGIALFMPDMQVNCLNESHKFHRVNEGHTVVGMAWVLTHSVQVTF
jgi:hypothetical protein